MADTKSHLIKMLHTILSAKGIADLKEQLYEPYGVTSSKDLSISQLRELVSVLNGSSPVTPKKVSDNTRKLRSACLKVITGDPEATNPRDRGLGLPTNDWSKINPFVKNHAGKQLNELTDQELEELKKKLYAIRDSGWTWKKQTSGVVTVPACLLFPTGKQLVN